MKIATICGSVSLGKEVWDKLAQKLSLAGYAVFTVNCWGMRDYLHSSQGAATKTSLDQLHKQKIAISTDVYVLMKSDYVGESTQREIDFAEEMNVPITYIDIDEDDMEWIYPES